MKVNVYLVPGFFGFTSMASLNYFNRVADVLTEALTERDVEATVVECVTRPTGSIRRRADRLLDDVVASGGLEADAIHFVGHSTGGLDIRLLTTPGVRLRADDTEVKVGERTRSVISVSTPHFGTPLANYFTTLPGRQLLRLLTVLAASTGGRYALYGGTRLLSLAARIDDVVGRRKTFMDSLASRVFSNITTSEDDPVYAFFKEIARDQGAIIQLTPESMNLFNAAVVDRDDVSYASLLTVAPPPPRYYRTEHLVGLSRAALAGAFTLMHSLAAREHAHYPYPYRGEEALAEWVKTFPYSLDSRANDGVVPTLSQVYGKVLDVVQGDHLDVVGQFTGSTDDPHSDWLPSGSRFDEVRFRHSWNRVADEIAATTSRS